MRWNGSRRAASAVAVIVAAAGGLLVSPEPAFSGEAPNCRLEAFVEWNPTEDSIAAEGARVACVQRRAWVRVRLREHISTWPDNTVAEKTVYNIVNGGPSFVWYCAGNTGTFYAEIDTNAGGKAQSDRVVVSNC